MDKNKTMKDRFLCKEDIGKLISSVREKGGRFIAPSVEARQTVYKEVSSREEIASGYILPRNSFKEFLFPQTEVVAEYSLLKDGIGLKGRVISPRETVIFGARPCEAASVASLRAVFTWGFIDEFYTKREDRSVVVTIACTAFDDACFCTTVALSPETTSGADLYLVETEGGDYIARAVTEKGESFVNSHSQAFSGAPAPGGAREARKTAMPAKIAGIDLERMKKRLKDKEHYGEPLWAGLASKCIGCGACTFVCPTCHCFDITDEGTAFEGERRKNWDACQFDHFTLHASGHNPRDVQYKRWRNRFMCKFNIYPEKFSSPGCVGCGRCIRVCPVRLDITEVMEALSR